MTVAIGGGSESGWDGEADDVLDELVGEGAEHVDEDQGAGGGRGGELAEVDEAVLMFRINRLWLS